MMNGIFNFSRPSIPLGPSTETIATGGGAATPVAEDFASFLQNFLGQGGQPLGRDPTQQTTGIMQALNELIAGPDVRGQQSAVQQIIQQDTERQTANLRERFTAGGGSRGTPSAVAEGLFRSEVTPRIAAATGELDLRANQQRIQALMPFLQLLSGFAGRGVPQAEESIIVKPGPLDYLAGFAESGAGIAAGAS
ncbi:hypothetical protein LCGC14_2271560 [marine sediment metagenome]|uniref:Uncharacterized protein n=1 Tax=marine sediment metagenome TaxID=412755 RepID=A0A0F9CWU6_9ZZZZ